ncbi:hypothetical protein ABIB75_006512 [Bradyrhizobium sp. GM2.2]|uniref:hypothetical protein n=1 Tax=Bradyrhizobium sp. GM2.2 TaxID=3156358 RepID=UPI003397233D
MKIYIASDLHGEVWRTTTTLRRGLRRRGFRRRHAPADWAVSWLTNQRALLGEPILLVAGNHEYYGGVLEDGAARIRDRARGTNVIFLDPDEVPHRRGALPGLHAPDHTTASRRTTRRRGYAPACG